MFGIHHRNRKRVKISIKLGVDNRKSSKSTQRKTPMKSIIIIFALVSFNFSNGLAQTQNEIETDSVKTTSIEKQKVTWSAAWGLLGNAPKGKRVAFEFETSGFKEGFSPIETKLDTSKYVEKSYLWGAIKWTEKKYKS